MPKTLKVISIVLFFISLLPIVFSQAQTTDSIRFVTYYPSPYGSYRELRTKRMAIGNTYIQYNDTCWPESVNSPCTNNQIYTDLNNNGWSPGEEDLVSLVVQGNVGIGTASPGGILHVTKNAANPEFSAVVFANTGIGSSGVEIRTAAVNTAGGGYPYLDFTRGSTNDNAGGTPDGTARIWNAMDGTNKMFFGLNYPDTTRPDQAKVTIQENGNVGIGTTEPAAKLVVVGNADTNMPAATIFTPTGYPLVVQGDAISSTDLSTYLFISDKTSGETWGLQALNNGDFGIHQASHATWMTVQKDTGSVGIGTMEPQTKLDIRGHVFMDDGNGAAVFYKPRGNNSASSTANFYFREEETTGSPNLGSGSNPGIDLFLINDDGTYWSKGGVQTSDLRYKKNIQTINSAPDIISKIRGVKFEWNADEYPKKAFPTGEHYGVIAQEIEKIIPEIVKEGPDGEKSIAYTELIPILIEAIKTQQKQIDELKAKLEN